MTQQAQPTPSLGTPRVVAVTGASGYIGKRLVERLLSEESVQRVVGIDIRPSPIEHDKLVSLEQDITEPIDTVFRRHRVEAVVHLAFMMRQLRDREESRRINIGGSSNVLWACEAAQVKRIVLMSSSTVYGAHPGDEPLAEEAPLDPPRGFSYANDKAEVERFYRGFAEQRAGIEVSVLRSCVVMGPHAENFITKALDKPVLLGVGREDPPMQFLHEEDLLDVLWHFIIEAHSGVYNVAGPGTVPWSEVVRMGGKRLLRFSAPIAYGITNLAWRLRLQNEAPGAGLDYVRWPWVVSTALLEQELGYEFRHTSRDAIESCLLAPPEPEISTAGSAAGAGDSPEEPSTPTDSES